MRRYNSQNVALHFVLFCHFTSNLLVFFSGYFLRNAGETCTCRHYRNIFLETYHKQTVQKKHSWETIFTITYRVVIWKRGFRHLKATMFVDLE